MFHLLSALSLLLAVSALPNPSPTPTRVLAQRQEPSLQASLTYASNNPAATTNRQANPSISPELTQQLAVAATVGDRFKIIYDQGPDYWKFDFLPNSNPYGGLTLGRGGEVVLANKKNYPILWDQGVSVSLGFMNPCGMNTPHIHPRATEFNIAVSELTLPLRAGFVFENDFNLEFRVNISQYQGASFPRGATHFEMNPNCEPAVFVAAFSNDDPGLSSIANNFFRIDADIINSTLGFPREISGENIAQFATSIPTPFVVAVTECLDCCGIPY
ncbi:MAG: hypothetical protein TREMPRED_001316 [Tremellales sp. Tagirdzhanova-0007]|nr:MAG: hypothetical protein TREMPRED_001316 [Tremellales sp. Tagirdzhanova-0007]